MVTITAFSRRSGNTGMDMAHVQKMRFESKEEPDVTPSLDVTHLSPR